jgi:zinc D-Ala-D-Ala carboxypeptidase
VLLSVAVTVGVALLLVRTALPGILPGAPFEPGVADGVIPVDQSVTIHDADLPAISSLDRALADAVRSADAAASGDGISLVVTSGWRSAAYQQQLFDEAVQTYGSAEVAAQFVATADRSAHVTGDAVDIGPLDAQLWLGEHGAQWGLCQIYANERWHFELATTPHRQCPAQLPDASF